jgi:hypothetical protein
LAVPSTPSTGSRATYFPAQPPPFANPNAVAPGGPTLLAGAFGTPPQPLPVVDMPILSPAGLPAIVIRAGTGASPDFAGTLLLVFDQNGVVYTRSNVISTTTWTGLGSPPTVAHWALVDALS